MLERLAKDKHSSLLGLFVSYIENELNATQVGGKRRLSEVNISLLVDEKANRQNSTLIKSPSTPLLDVI